MQASEAIAKLRQFSVCQISDALGPSCSIETSLLAIDPTIRICGPALTVECAPGDNLTVHHALHLACPGDVLVVACSSRCGGALWGELMSMSAQAKGVAGTIVDGAVRDSLETRTLGYPVFCRSFDPRRASKEIYGRINIPIRIGTLTIAPKDILLADSNGIVSIAQSRLDEAVELTSKVAKKENDIKNEIRSGRTIFEIFNLEQFVMTGHHDGKSKTR